MRVLDRAAVLCNAGEDGVGITEQAWEVREEELARVHNLQTERAREEQLLDEELREVLDDANNTTGTGGTTR